MIHPDEKNIEFLGELPGLWKHLKPLPITSLETHVLDVSPTAYDTVHKNALSVLSGARRNDTFPGLEVTLGSDAVPSVQSARLAMRETGQDGDGVYDTLNRATLDISLHFHPSQILGADISDPGVADVVIRHETVQLNGRGYDIERHDLSLGWTDEYRPEVKEVSGRILVEQHLGGVSILRVEQVGPMSTECLGNELAAIPHDPIDYKPPTRRFGLRSK